MRDPEIRGKRWGSGPAFFFGLILLSPTALADYEFFARTTVSAVSEPEPIKTTLKDWGAEFDGGERQWVVGHAETGVRWRGGLEVSLFSRALADLRMNRSAVDFYGRISRKEPLEEGREVPVHLEVNGFTGQGLRLGYRHEASRWALTGGLSLFRTSHLLAGALDGKFSATGNSDYAFDADVDYQYFQDFIFERPDVEEADGLGWSVDLKLDWQIDEDWSWSLQAEDLLARVRWQDAPYTVARASTDQKSYDENGYAVFAPLLSGREGYRSDFYQDLEARYDTTLSHRWNQWSASVRGQYQFGYGYAGFGGGYHFAGGVTVRGIVWPRHDLVGLEVQFGRFEGTLAVDQVEWGEMQALVVGFSYGY